MNMLLVRREPETPEIENFFWQPLSQDTGQPVSLEFRPGQFLRWSMVDPEPDDRGNSRFFSIASSPTEKLVQLSTRFNAERSSSFKAKLKQQQPGATLTAVGPLGDFVLPDHGTSLVLVAGGIGITPFRSMLKYLDDTNDDKYQIELIYASRNDRDFVFRLLIDEIAGRRSWLKVMYVAETAGSDWPGDVGRLDGRKILDLCGGVADKLTYLSGPEPMTKALFDDLVRSGVREESLKTDYFPGYSQL